MNESILDSIKSLLPIDKDITDFDGDLIVLINSSLSRLLQLGVGDKPFRIEGSSETWSQLLNKEEYLDAVKEVVFIDVKMVFDPPTSSVVMEALKAIRNEDMYRITTQIEIANPLEEPEDEYKKIDYNDLINKPSLDGVVLQGDVRMDIANKDYVDEKIGEIEDGYY